jgi:multiple sugar transport system permease protein
MRTAVIKKQGKKSLFYFFTIFGVVIIIFPFIWMVMASFKTHAQIMDISKTFVFTPILNNYTQVFTTYSFGKPILNSLIIALWSTLMGLALGLPAAYAIARFKMKKANVIIVITRIIPGLSFLVPWFIMFTNLGLVDTHLSLVLTHMLVGLPLIVWVMIPFFESLPKELEESGLVDGCNNYQAFLMIVMPLTGPGVITSVLLSFIYSWNNFMFALILAGYNTKTLPVAIFNFIEYAQINWGGLMAASVVITLPIIAISLMLQKYIIKGLTAGAVKG